MAVGAKQATRPFLPGHTPIALSSSEQQFKYDNHAGLSYRRPIGPNQIKDEINSAVSKQ